MNLTQRTLKISMAAVLSTLIAQALSLQNPFSAGVVGLLSLLDTRVDSMKTGLERFLSTILAFAIATLMFNIFGFTVWAFGIYLLVYVPSSYLFKLDAGLSPCTVLVTHFIAAQSTSLTWQINGLSLMAIGVIVAVALNIWMPSNKQKIEEMIGIAEDRLSVTLNLISERLRREEFAMAIIKNKCQSLEKYLIEMQELARLDYGNQLTDKNEYYLKYIEMRLQQLNMLERMTSSLQLIELQTEQNNTLATMFSKTAAELHETNSGQSLLEDIHDLYVFFRDSPLPQSRQEFESRALLYQVLLDFERFLEIKHKFYTENRREKNSA